MSLDLNIYKTENVGKNSKGQEQHLSTFLYDLKNCHEVYEILNRKHDFQFGNCSTVAFEANTLFDAYHELQDDMKYEENEDMKDEISYNIQELENFFEQNDLNPLESTDEVFDIYVWY